MSRARGLALTRDSSRVYLAAVTLFLDRTEPYLAPKLARRKTYVLNKEQYKSLFKAHALNTYKTTV